MKKIEFQNNITKLNKTTFDEFQSNIEEAVLLVTESVPTIENSLSSDSEVNGASIHSVNMIIQQNLKTGGPAVRCGYKIDNKDVYVKRVNLGNLPNNNITTKPHGLAINEITIIRFEAIAKSGNIYLNLPHAASDNTNDSIFINDANVQLQTVTNRSSFVGYIDIYFINN